MDDNVLDQLDVSLQQLSSLLDDQAVKTAIGAIPDSIMDPVINGLKTIMDVINDALIALRDSLNSVLDLQKEDGFLSTVNGLLEAAGGLAPSQQDTLDSVKNIIKTLQDIPGLQQIEDLITKVNVILDKLKGL